MINDLYQAFTEGKANVVTVKIVKELVKYTQYHFKSEEEHFLKLNYPEAEKHIEQHNSFTETVLKFSNDLSNNEVSLSYELMDFLRKWLIDHIMGTDKQYVGIKNK